MSDTDDIGEVASTVTSSDANLTQAITGASYAAGAAEEVVEIEKFKTHKENPQSIP